MKKLLLSASALMAFGAFAQQRLVLVEAFSQASCGPCVTPNANLDALMQANPDKAVTIKYQVSWPGVDPMNAQNPTEVATRVGYYGVSGVPSRALDGTITPVASVNQAAIDTRYAVPAPVTMDMTHTINADFTANVSVTVNAPAVWNPTNTVLHVAMVEKNITFATAPGSNGETVFKNVMRKMIPNDQGSAVLAANFATAGGSQTFNFNNIVLPNYIYNINEVRFIAWVQNVSSKEVHQAALTEPQPISNYGVVQSIGVTNNYSCAASLDGASIVIKNQGTNNMTSATVHYQLNGGTIQTAPFNGNVAPNATAPFTLPNITVPSSGTHTLTTFLTNINGSGVTNPLGTQATQFARITDAGTAGQFIQDFSATGFPYTNYFITSPTNDNWLRINANSGCIAYPFYSVTSGKSGEVFLAPVNMTTNSANQMTFDVTYKQYQAENDRLEVFVSNDCGATWTSVFNKAGSALATLPPATASYNAPAASDWRNESVSLANFGSAEKLIVKFKASSAYGNNLFVDNIMIGGSAAIVEYDGMAVNVYPNPANEAATVSFEAQGDYAVVLTDMTGRNILNIRSNANGNVQEVLNLQGLTSGVYMVNISTNGQTATRSLVVR